jgi:colicin import membrane protein
VNTNAPALVVGGDPSVGSSSADQTAKNKADADASNKSKTDQDATATQTAGDSLCFSGCGGNGQEQNVVQVGKTKQHSDADAKAKQDAENANVPVSILGDDLSGSGSSSADQTAKNKADADASNKSKTDQDATATQIGGDTACWYGCGGNGQEQNVIQVGKTKQGADSDATAKQKAVNANSPILVVGGDPSVGSSSADQTAKNKADADASNRSKTDQDATATQLGGSLACFSGCGGNGQEQNVVQIGKTKQHADADAKAKQKAENANSPASILGGKQDGSGSSSADQTARNKADSDASNKSKTEQDANPTQAAGSTWCPYGCGNGGQAQNVIQKSKTKQGGRARSYARQRLINYE